MNRQQRRAASRRGAQPAGNDPGMPPEIQQLVERARALHESGRAKDAIAFLRSRCKGRRIHPYVLSVLGAYEVRAGFELVGLNRCGEAARLAGDSFVVLSNLGAQLTAQGHAGEAVTVLTRAVGLAPDAHDVRFNLAKALFLSDRLDAAEDEIRTYSAACPTDLAGHFLLIDILERKRKPDEAIGVCTALIDRNPTDSAVHEKYIDLLVYFGRIEAAFSHLEALEERPDVPAGPALAQKQVDVLALLGDFDAAIDLGRSVLARFPDASSLLHQHAAVLLSTGRFHDGWAAFCSLPQWSENFAKLPHSIWRNESLDC